MRKSNVPDVEPIWAPIPLACRLSGLGRSKLYELMDQGVLRSAKVGGRRLILVASIRALGGEQAA